MFRLAKYYILLNLYRRAKKNIVSMVVSLLTMGFVSFIFSDIIEVARNSSQFGLIAIKWLTLLSLFAVIIFNLLKIMKIASVPFEDKDRVPDERKEKLLAKEHLKSRSDLIFEKYRSNK